MERQVPEGIQVNLSIRRASFIVHSNSSSEVLGIFIPYKLQRDFNVDFKSFLKCYLKRQKEEYAWIRKLSTGWVSSTACLASYTFSQLLRQRWESWARQATSTDSRCMPSKVN